ncbi:hypothetical protein AMATHDRAFT_149972 [Amanita thiersii Skay4041]|uniref:Uncharacterized protein n=1 Tax=Amanita thiersii Skay4041 TaxID=703135 RepID=A0A2A9NCP2_9AGAR|nr:hypothetical protein AMATHDRAFT_149972 [Amanita thiersii Skay4041]
MHLLRSWCSTTIPRRLPSAHRQYAISVRPQKPLSGRIEPRVFKDKKAFQYNWYTNILKESKTGPLLFLNHNDFSARRLVKLRRDIATAAKRTALPSLDSPSPIPAATQLPQLTVFRTSIFGAALRDFPHINLAEVDRMFSGTSGSFAALSLPSFNPPQLNAILRVMERSVPPRPPKTEEDLKREQAEKNADPDNPGRRMKRQRPILTPELKLIGAFIEGKVFLPQGLQEVSKLPTLDTLRAQIVGLLSSPGMQLAAVLNEAGGAKLARTLEGLKKSMEEEAGGTPVS